MTTTLRATSVSGATTVSRPLTHEEMDANFLFTQSGSGASTETIQAALRRLVHTAQYSSNANFETARAALTGEFGVNIISAADVRTWISTDTVDSRFYRADATFNDTVNPGTFYGYNLTGFGQIEDAAKSSLMLGFESNYNDGSVRYLEMHWNMAGPGQSYVRPLQFNYALTGADANKITEIAFLTHKDFTVLASTGDIQLTGSTLTFSGTAEHTGTFLVSSFIFHNNNASDASSAIQIGIGDQGETSRTAVRCRPGGYGVPTDVNTLSNGDKFSLWNTAAFKTGFGINATGGFWFQCNGSSASDGYLWYGGTGDTPAVQMRLASAGWLIQQEVASNPGTSDLTADGAVAIYNKADKLVFSYNNGGTLTYITLDLDGSDTTWTHGTSAP